MRLLAARGCTDAASVAAFLEPRLEHAHPPWLMRGIETATARIVAAIASGEPIRIFGDYDADGITAVVVLRQALATLGARVDYRLPHRIHDGYGLTEAALTEAHAQGVRLAITVDTGIREFAALAQARALALDVIVTDHHLPGPELPPAEAILNPNQPGCGYPNKALTGAGIAFKLAQALLERSGRVAPGEWPPHLRSYLKLVAIGTIADSAPLLGENRVLTAAGLAGLADARNAGLRALLALARDGRGGAVRAHDVAFRIAPRLNAAGRMGSADCAVELFSAPPEEAGRLAETLEEMNRERRRVAQQLLEPLQAELAASPEAPVRLLAGAGWHRGVLGLVATRLMRQSGAAVVLASLEDEGAAPRAHGSGRAPAGLPLLELFEGCADLFATAADGGERVRYGGHAQAIGFCLPAGRLEALRRRLDERAQALGLKPQPPDGGGQAEADLGLAEIDARFVAGLSRMEPFGEGNREPVFRARGVRLAAPPSWMKELHLKLVVEQNGRRFDALLWQAANLAGARQRLAGLGTGDRLDICFRIEASSHHMFGERIQLVLEGLPVRAPQAVGAA